MSSLYFQEIVLKRAADLAEALYDMPSNRGALPQSRSSPMSNSAMANYNGYASQLSSEHELTSNGQWKDGESNLDHRHPHWLSPL